MSKLKLNQVLAIEKNIKTSTNDEVTAVYHQLQKKELLTGLARTYQPRGEAGSEGYETLPAESKLVQVRAEDALRSVASSMTALFDITATKDFGNTKALADVVVDGEVLIKDCPATYLLFLEKQLTDFHTVVKKLPVLDSAEEWQLSTATNNWATSPVETVKTKKVLKNHVKAAATDKHPAQVETYSEDVPVGTWKNIKFSGALPQARVVELTNKVEKLLQAVKFAREDANSSTVDDKKFGKALFKYLLG